MECIRACARAHPFLTMVTTRSLIRLRSNLADLFRSPDTADLFLVSETAKLAGARRRRNFPGLGDSGAGKGSERQSWPKLRCCGAGLSSETVRELPQRSTGSHNVHPSPCFMVVYSVCSRRLASATLATSRKSRVCRRAVYCSRQRPIRPDTSDTVGHADTVSAEEHRSFTKTKTKTNTNIICHNEYRSIS